MVTICDLNWIIVYLLAPWTLNQTISKKCLPKWVNKLAQARANPSSRSLRDQLWVAPWMNHYIWGLNIDIASVLGRRFLLRCLGNGIIPVSIRVKNSVRTYRSDCIIQKAERQKNRLINILRIIKTEGRIQLEPVHQNYMGLPRFTRKISPWGPLYQVGALSHKGYQKSWQEFWNPWLGTPFTMSSIPWNLQMTSKRSSLRKESASFQMMYLPFLHQSQ